jgi:3-oxoadipate enol-lactonase
MRSEVRVVRSEDLDVEVEITGSGPMLVLIMGLGATQDGWKTHVEHLAQDFTCVTFDNRGVGRTRLAGSGGLPPPPYSIAGFADDAANVIRALGDAPAHICGLSMGGAIALRLAVDHPELVRTLSVHSTWDRVDNFLEEIFRFREVILRELGPTALERYVGLWAWGPASWEGQADASPVSATETLIGRGAPETWEPAQVEAYLGHVQASIDHDVADRLHEIACRTLVTVGSEDILTHPRFARRIAGAIPDARLEVIEGGGHAYCFEYQETFRRTQREFLMADPG